MPPDPEPAPRDQRASTARRRALLQEMVAAQAAERAARRRGDRLGARRARSRLLAVYSALLRESPPPA